MKKFLKVLTIAVLMAILTPIVTLVVLYHQADMMEPRITIFADDYTTKMSGDSLICQDSYLRYDSCGLWELRISGSDQIRGAKQGALTKELMRYQEDVFIEQIRNIIPSDRYLGFLRKFIIIFNRNIAKHIPIEYRNEIAAMSQFCTHEYDVIGTPYERQLNYHAAHDIGHTMQQYMLVGCSSFGVWGERTATEDLLIGRNFDFYVGDDFAKNKLITFASPEGGYSYVSVGWAGMIGVLSGMNSAGLSVTINAAKGAIPTSAATPISILTREILQYASTIEEAYEIASKRETFVCESILVGSVNDAEAAIIEKTPEKTAIYRANGDQIICTNHYQSEGFANDKYNLENIEDSDSKYRFDRLEELLTRENSLDHSTIAKILRDSRGLNDRDIGIGNEMTINQSIAHHSVIFNLSKSQIWISTSPWQSGKMVCYDLTELFESDGDPTRLTDLDIAADSIFMEQDYNKLINFRDNIKIIAKSTKQQSKLDENFIESFISQNPNYYHTYQLLGEYYTAIEDTKTANRYYKKMLSCEIPYKSTRAQTETIIKNSEE